MRIDKELVEEVQQELSSDSFVPDIDFIEQVITVYEQRKLVRKALELAMNTV